MDNVFIMMFKVLIIMMDQVVLNQHGANVIDVIMVHNVNSLQVVLVYQSIVF